MTVLTTAATTGPIQGNGVTMSFTYAFIIPFLEDEITPAVNVWYTDLTGNKQLMAPNTYTITGVGVPAGGTVIFSINGVPITTGTFIQIDRAVPYIQPDSFPNQSFLPESVEEALDNLEEQIQQLVAGVGAVFINSPVSLTFRVFGGGASPSTGVLGDMYCPFPVKIIAWTLQADQAGSMAVDIWSLPFSQDTPPTVANSICGGNYPTLTAHQQIQSATLTNWTTLISGGSAFRFNLRSIATIQNFTLTLSLARLDPSVIIPVSGGGGGGGGGGGPGGNPTGAAGGDLSGTYPNPVLAVGVVDTDELVAGSVTNGILAQMPTHTVKANNTGGSAVPQDVTYAALATAMGLTPGAAVGVQQWILFSLTGGAYALVASGPAGAAGPTASRTGVGVVNVTLGTTALTSGYYDSTVCWSTGDEGGACSGPGSVMAANGTYTFHIQHYSSKTAYDANLILIKFY